MGDLSEHFDRSEFACKCGCGFDTVDIELVALCEAVRQNFGRPVHVPSGCRCLDYNTSISGSDHSQHMLGRAADIMVDGVSADVVQEWLEAAMDGEGGIGRYALFTHLDTRSDGPARWEGATVQ